MNDAAVQALRPGTVPLAGEAPLHPELAALLRRGLKARQGALTFAARKQIFARDRRDLAKAIADGRWQDLSDHEWDVNELALEPYAPVTVTELPDGASHISEADQVLLLRLGLQVAEHVIRLARALPSPAAVSCVISANDTSGTFRFYQTRPGEDMLVEDLDGYSLEKLVVVEDLPPAPG